jgi:hypothetical protein
MSVLSRPLPLRLQRHELSAKFGDMSEEELEQLKQDIKENGLREPVTLYEDKVLDGWHRYRCLCALGIKLKEGTNCQTYDPEFDGEKPDVFVLSKNVFRRQLSAEDRVRFVAETLGYKNAGPGRKTKVSFDTISMKKVAEVAKVSLVTAKRALGKTKVSSDTISETKVSNETIKKEATVESLRKKIKKLETQLGQARQQLAAMEKEAAAPKKNRADLLKSIS